MDSRRLKFLMDVQGQLDALEKKLGSSDASVVEMKEKFYKLANNEFTNTVLRDIHEEFVEDILKSQANSFYSSFPASLKNNMVKDFIQMERQRRKNLLENFAFNIFQQLECVINEFFFSKTLNLFAQFEKDRKGIVLTKQKTKDLNGNPIVRDFDLQQLILNDPKLISEADFANYFKRINSDRKEFERIPIHVRLRLVSYYEYYQKKLHGWYDFQNLNYRFNDIKLMRNIATHPVLSTLKPEEVKKVNDMKSNSGKSFLTFYSFLHDFMSKVSVAPDFSKL